MIGCNADMETCEYIISGHTFERRAMIDFSADTVKQPN